MLSNICTICGKPVGEADHVKCSVCNAVMHRSCASDEALTDADGNVLCPYDAMMAALDWFDAVASTYSSSLSEDQRGDVIGRLRSYLELLGGREAT